MAVELTELPAPTNHLVASVCRCSAGIGGLQEQGIINTIVCRLITDYTLLFGDLTEPGPFSVPYIHSVRLTVDTYSRHLPLSSPLSYSTALATDVTF